MTSTAAAPAPHRYEYPVQLDSGTAPAQVVNLVGAGRRVLEFGCGPGSITRNLQAQGCTITGVDVDPTALEKVAEFCVSTHSLDLNSADWSPLARPADGYERVVAADVLEHLYDPLGSLRRMIGYLAPEGRMVISVPHAGHACLLGCLMAGDFQYRDWGLLDRTHIRFFGLSNIDKLLEDAGLATLQVRYVLKPPEDTEFKSLWLTLPRYWRQTLECADHAHVYQVVVEACRREQLPHGAQSLSVAKSLPSSEVARAQTASSLTNRLKVCLSPT